MYTLADQLKYFDPAFERMLDDTNISGDDNVINANVNAPDNQPWLQELLATLQQFNVSVAVLYCVFLLD